VNDGLLIAFGVVLVLIGVGAIVVGVRRQRADPHIWVPRQHGAAVQRALRDGHADDPRIDALARSAAARAIRQRWTLWFLPFGVLLFGAATVSDLRDPDTTWWDLVGSAVWTALPAFVLVHQIVQLRRSRRYLEHQP
jgi:hypothetical protein